MSRRLVQHIPGVVVVGYLLGGNLNAGTVLFVLTIGPIVHMFLPRPTVGRPVTEH